MTAHKRSLGQGNVFIHVCLFTGGSASRGFASRGVGSLTLEGVCIQPTWEEKGLPTEGDKADPPPHPPRIRKVGSMHPTGMLSSL